MRTHSRTAPLWNIGHDLHHPKYQLATIPMRICYFQILHRYRFTNYYGVSWRILCWNYQPNSETLFETFSNWSKPKCYPSWPQTGSSERAVIANQNKGLQALFWKRLMAWCMNHAYHIDHMVWWITILKTEIFISEISILKVKEVQGTLQHKLIWNKLPQITSLAN